MPTGFIPDRTPLGTVISNTQEAFPDSDRWKFMGSKMTFTAASGDTQASGRFDITTKVAFNGAALLLNGHQRGDWSSLRIVSNGLMPAFGPDGTVLNVFAPGWWADWERAFQGEIVLPYRGTLEVGMAIEIVFHKQTGYAVDCYANLFLHEEL